MANSIGILGVDMSTLDLISHADSYQHLSMCRIWRRSSRSGKQGRQASRRASGRSCTPLERNLSSFWSMKPRAWRRRGRQGMQRPPKQQGIALTLPPIEFSIVASARGSLVKLQGSSRRVEEGCSPIANDCRRTSEARQRGGGEGEANSRTGHRRHACRTEEVN